MTLLAEDKDAPDRRCLGENDAKNSDAEVSTRRRPDRDEGRTMTTDELKRAAERAEAEGEVDSADRRPDRRRRPISTMKRSNRVRQRPDPSAISLSNK